MRAKLPFPARPAGRLHPRNRHQGRYDFPALIAASPELAAFVVRNVHGDDSIDFADPAAVRALNRALLKQVYGVSGWDIPPGYLCPPIPGRADYLHCLADLLAEDNGGVIPHGPAICALDIGVGANCVYPLIGQAEYGWRFVGVDIDKAALRNAQAIIDANDGLSQRIALCRQPSADAIFRHVVRDDDVFDLSLCNPPFHASPEEAGAGSRRKWQNLGKSGRGGGEPVLNFGGRHAELWCPGGEAAFVSRMIAESAHIPERCLWFSSLISRSASLPAVYRALKRAGVRDSRTIDMAQGQKQSRLVAWTWLDPVQRTVWLRRRL